MRSLVSISTAALVVLLLPALPAQATVITVTVTNDELNADGDCSLREAIQAANMDQPVSGCPAGAGPDQITLGAGLYSIGINEPTEAGNNQGDFDLHSDITISGAGPGLTLVGAGKSDRAFEQHSFGHTSAINQLTIRNGDATTSVGFQGGGGIFNGNGSTLALDNVEVRTSTAPQGGGGIFNFGSLTITNSTVTLNSAPGNGGGGIVNQFGQLTVDNSSVTMNTAESAGGIQSQGNLTVTDSTISDNSASTFSAGGIVNDGFAILTNSTINNNTGNIGAGIDNHGQLTVNGGSVSGNVANEQGGGIRNTQGNLELNGTTIANNSANDGGGGLATSGGFTQIFGGTTFSGNTTDEGGGAIRAGGELEMTGGTIDNNQAALSGCCGGGGISVDGNAFVTLQSVTLSNNFSAQDAGGAIFNFGRLVLDDTVVTGNSVDGQGGGIHNDPGATLFMTGGELTGNTAEFGGGGLSAEGQGDDGGSFARLESVTVDGNSATNGAGGGIFGNGPFAELSIDGSTISGNDAVFGGGMLVRGDAHIVQSTIIGNAATEGGGGLFVSDGSLTLSDSDVTANDAQVGGGLGISEEGLALLEASTVSGNTATEEGGGISAGGFDQEGGVLIVRRSTIDGNDAPTGGGIANRADAVLFRSTVSGNSAAEFGGGIADLGESSMVVKYSTVSGNDATYGGGISEQGDLALRQSTVSGNSAVVEGGGLQVWTDHGPIEPSAEGSAVFRYATLAGNSAPFAAAYNNQAGESDVLIKNTVIGDSVGGADCEWPFHSGGFNVIENPGPGCTGTGKTGSNVIGVDPKLGPLANNGGPTMTHDLLAGSPALDSASPVCPPPHVDQRGEPRGWPDFCDRGALEKFQPGLLFFELGVEPGVFELTPAGNFPAAGELLCGPAGHTWRAELSLTQGNRSGRRAVSGTCTGEPQSWNRTIIASPSPFTPGPATWCEDVRTFNLSNVQTDRDQECFEIELQ